MVLEHYGTLRPRAVDLAALELDAARGYLGETGDQVQQGGLAAAGWPMMEITSPFALSRLTSLSTSERTPAAVVEMLVDVFDAKIGHCNAPQLAAVPRVTKAPMAATRRSRMKPTTPM